MTISASTDSRTRPAAPPSGMTPRERWLAILERRAPDRIPTDIWATKEVYTALFQHFGTENYDVLWRRLHIDRPRQLGAPHRTGQFPTDPERDMWGVAYRTIRYETGDYAESQDPPMAAFTTVDEIRNFPWPSPDDYDYAVVRDAVAADDGYRILQAGSYEPFLLMCKLRGIEQGFADLAMNPEIADAILGRLFEFFYEQNRRLFDAGGGRIKLTYVAEDLGGQQSPLMSLPMYRRYFRANQKRMADLARQHGVHVIYHTDGAARLFLPDLIDEVGIEVLNPLQWRCPGMEREGLVRDFGGRIAFHGGMDNQQTMPFGTVDDVTAEVRENLEIFRQARWICAPCHNLQAVTPIANIIAMYDTIHELGAR
ncbi:MAG: uroporphyrinogen decarboxylase family protein [Lentisphaerae bacterium]|nr:uroporphyrinogen decarboxylase family protein [Lentisphaerota bacterium]